MLTGSYKFANLVMGFYLFITLIYLSSHFITHLRQNFSNVSLRPRISPETEVVLNAQHVVWSNAKETYQRDYIEKSFSQGLGSNRLYPFYFKAQAVSSSLHDVTITTLVTAQRLDALERLAQHYQGPISAVLHVPDDERQTEVLEHVKQIYAQQPSMNQFVDVHVLIDKYERQFNMWRNLAKMYARTDYILMLDVDFLVSPTVRSVLTTLPPKTMDAVRQGTAALVLPAFEELINKTQQQAWFFPSTKDELISLVNEGRIAMFHKFWLKGHGSTNYTKWYTASSVYKVTEYNFAYEPYVIVKKKGTAWCDERFIGYGANKAACHFELYISGMDYFVLPDEYLIHQYHPYPEQTRSHERHLNKKLYEHFREEICFRYARSMMARGVWNTKQSANIKKECRKIRHWNSLIRGAH